MSQPRFKNPMRIVIKVATIAVFFAFSSNPGVGQDAGSANVPVEAAPVEAAPVEADASVKAESLSPAKSPSPSPAESSSPLDQWPVARGNLSASGFVSHSLPPDLIVLWETKTTEAIEATPVVANNRIVVVDVMGTITTLDLDNGEILWKESYETGFVGAAAIAIQPAGSGSPVTGIDEPGIGETATKDSSPLVYAGDVEGNVYCWSLASGQLKWKQTTDGQIDGSPSFFKNLVLITSQDGKLHAFDALDGKPKWQYESGDQIRCSPTIVDSETLLGGCDAKLHRIDLETGTAAGPAVPLSGPTGSTPAAGARRIVVPAMDGTVFAIKRSDFSIEWKYSDPDQEQEYRNDAAIGDQLVILSSARKSVDALSIEDGTRQWQYVPKKRSDASPVIAGEDVWLATTDGRLIRLSLADGTEKWTHEIRGGYVAAPAILKERLVVADDKGVVRCFGKKLSQ
jgi:outer membrane protein assembly factor BamB